jgi:hypothetical protein
MFSAPFVLDLPLSAFFGLLELLDLTFEIPFLARQSRVRLAATSSSGQPKHW